jgi:hypothetical protein
VKGMFGIETFRFYDNIVSFLMHHQIRFASMYFLICCEKGTIITDEDCESF